jgi:hypothetical protein
LRTTAYNHAPFHAIFNGIIVEATAHGVWTAGQNQAPFHAMWYCFIETFLVDFYGITVEGRGQCAWSVELEIALYKILQNYYIAD